MGLSASAAEENALSAEASSAESARWPGTGVNRRTRRKVVLGCTRENLAELLSKTEHSAVGRGRAFRHSDPSSKHTYLAHTSAEGVEGCLASGPTLAAHGHFSRTPAAVRSRSCGTTEPPESSARGTGEPARLDETPALLGVR